MSLGWQSQRLNSRHYCFPAIKVVELCAYCVLVWRCVGSTLRRNCLDRQLAPAPSRALTPTKYHGHRPSSLTDINDERPFVFGAHCLACIIKLSLMIRLTSTWCRSRHDYNIHLRNTERAYTGACSLWIGFINRVECISFAFDDHWDIKLWGKEVEPGVEIHLHWIGLEWANTIKWNVIMGDEIELRVLKQQPQPQRQQYWIMQGLRNFWYKDEIVCAWYPDDRLARWTSGVA